MAKGCEAESYSLSPRENQESKETEFGDLGVSLGSMKKLTQKKMGKFRHAVIAGKFGYTNECNPFNDNHLSDPFIWKKKQKLLGAMGRAEKTRTPTQFLDHTKQKISEIENVKKRREAREEEERLLEQQQAILARERELENYAEWESREEAFHRVMDCRRTDVRLKLGRERPADLIVKALRLLDGEDFSNCTLLHCYPHEIFHQLSPDNLKTLLADIETHYNVALKASLDPQAFTVETNWAQRLETSDPSASLMPTVANLSSHLDVWKAMKLLGEQASHRLVQDIPSDSSYTTEAVLEANKTRDTHSGIALSVLEDLDTLMKTKSLKELEALEVQVANKRQSITQDPCSEADMSYWDTVYEKLPHYKAIALLKNMHERAVQCAQMLQYKQQSGSLKPSSEVSEEVSIVEPQRDVTSATPTNPAEFHAESNTEDVAWKPVVVPLNSLKGLQLDIMTEDEFNAKRNKLRQQLILKYQKDSENLKKKKCVAIPLPPKEPYDWSVIPKNVFESFVDAEKRNMTADEFIMTPAYLVNLPSTPINQEWDLKYCPRKPRFFNRVKTGYEWNKYNQTHYDRDTPPPKAVQGYKFNLFYPDLIDQTKAPTWKLLPSDEPETVLILFHGGPPYEDVIFKIFNREWELNPRTGYRNVFHRGILQLHFNFKRYRYRR